MNNKTNRRLRIALIALAAYLLLLCLLVMAERNGDGALIDTLPKALWFSVVTLTTVGYGELYPVTLPGKLVGGVFLILSTGLLALLVGMICAAITGRMFPRLRLWRRRRDKWYVFTADNEASRALASRLKDGAVIFCGAQSHPANDALALDIAPEDLFRLPFAAEGPRCLFAMDDDASANERLAAMLQDSPVKIYCRTDGLDEGLPANVSTFSDWECAARLYWGARPWYPDGERVVLIGDGRFARALLFQGLLTAPPGCEIELFGDWSVWRREHRTLSKAPDRQFKLIEHSEDWRDCPDILRTARRVVLCGDDQEANREVLCTLRRFYVLNGRLDARCPRGLQRAWYFGDAEGFFTPELVMKQALNTRARRLHDLYRDSVDYPVPAWEELSDFMKRSNLAAADHLVTKLRLLLPEEEVLNPTPEACRRAAERYESASPDERERFRLIEHARWCLFHALYNWQYAPLRDNALRHHPMLVPYDQLDEAERRKDDNAWLLLRQLAEETSDPD